MDHIEDEKPERTKIIIDIDGVDARLVSKMWEVWAAESLHPGSQEEHETIKRIWFAAALSMFNTMTQVSGSDDLNSADIMAQLELMKSDMENTLDGVANVGSIGSQNVTH